MLKAIPDNSPLIAANLVCRQCGKTLEPLVVMQRRGKEEVADHLVYECKNEETGCSYRIETNVMINSEMIMIRKDGTEARPGVS